MSEFQKRLSSEFGIQPAYVETMEAHGLLYFTWHDSMAVGAQCSNCDTIIWLDPRLNSVLSESRPEEIPPSGNGYSDYYKEKLGRFLKELPDCPSCDHNSYNRFINNTSYPRFPDGTEFEDVIGDISLKNEDPDNIEIWWFEAPLSNE